MTGVHGSADDYLLSSRTQSDVCSTLLTMIFLVQTEDFHTEVGNDVCRVICVFRAGGGVFDVLVRRLS